ncbi:MAG: sigma-70 family RNA polymerase sigma factor [Armatimonadetes bacterium]|nr:sigma-70 family RNA polymerase sigma factor [Armatimonadota bacterium]
MPDTLLSSVARQCAMPMAANLGTLRPIGPPSRVADSTLRPSKPRDATRRSSVPLRKRRTPQPGSPAPVGPLNREGLVTAYEGLASSCVRWFLRRYRVPPALGLDLEDLRSEARLALCHAARSWDPGRGGFAAYAGTAIHNWLLNVCRLHRGSSIHRLEFISLSTPVGESGEDYLGDMLPDPDTPLDEQICHSQFATAVRHAVSELPPRDKQVIESLLCGRTVASIARDAGCSRQRIAQIQNRALRRLRQRLGDWMEYAVEAQHRA